MSNPIRKLVGQTAIYGLSSIIGRMLNFMLVPLYTYVFTNTADYGVVSELYAVVAFLIVLLTFGMETSFFRFYHDREDKEKVFQSAFWAVIGLNILFLLILLFFNQNIANAMLYPDHSEYIVLLGIIVAIDAMAAVPMAKLRAENKAATFAGIQFASIGVNIVLNLILLLIFFNPEYPEEGVLFILIANLLASLIRPLLLIKSLREIPFHLDWPLIKPMFRYAYPVAIAGFAGIINETIDRVLLKQMLARMPEYSIEYAESQVGIYSANYKLAMLITILLQAYRYAAEPFFFSQSKNENRNKLYAKVMNYFVAMVFFSFLLVSLNLDIFKYFIPNEAYWEGLKVVPILLLANVCLGIYFNQSIWYKLSDQTKFGAYIAIGGAALTLVINLLFIPTYGYMACAWATLIVYAAQMIASYLLGQKYYPIKYNLRKFVLYGTSALVLYLVTLLLPDEPFLLSVIIKNILIILYVWMIYSIERPTINLRFIINKLKLKR